MIRLSWRAASVSQKSTPQRSVNILANLQTLPIAQVLFVPRECRQTHQPFGHHNTTLTNKQHSRIYPRSSDRSKPSDTVVTCPHPIPERDFVTVCIARFFFQSPLPLLSSVALSSTDHLTLHQDQGPPTKSVYVHRCGALTAFEWVARGGHSWPKQHKPNKNGWYFSVLFLLRLCRTKHTVGW